MSAQRDDWLRRQGIMSDSREKWTAAYEQAFREAMPRIFDEYRRWRTPWWSRMVAWGIACLYAVGRL